MSVFILRGMGHCLVTRHCMLTAMEVVLSQPRHYYLLTYLLTPWSRVILEKQTGPQLVKILPAFYGTRMFITAEE